MGELSPFSVVCNSPKLYTGTSSNCAKYAIAVAFNAPRRMHLHAECLDALH
jgi:hypothetical protein